MKKQFVTDSDPYWGHMGTPSFDCYETIFKEIAELSCSLRNKLEELKDEFDLQDLIVTYKDEEGKEHSITTINVEEFTDNVSEIEDFFFEEC